MADNLKKKKLDAKRISLTQKHEVDYSNTAKKMKLGNTVQFLEKRDQGQRQFSVSSIRRIAKALLKAL